MTPQYVAHPARIGAPFYQHPIVELIEIIFTMETVKRGVIVTGIPGVQSLQYKIWTLSRLPRRMAAYANSFIKASQALKQLATIEGRGFGLVYPHRVATNVPCARRKASIDAAPSLVSDTAANKSATCAVQQLHALAQKPSRIPAIIIRKNDDFSLRLMPAVVSSGTNAASGRRRHSSNFEFMLIAFQNGYDSIVAILVCKDDFEIRKLLSN